MRRVINGRVLMAGVLCVLMGCGGSGIDGQGDDGLTMALVGLTGVGIEQADFVTDTLAQVDICQDLCTSGAGGEITVEPFTATVANVRFVNRGKADILLDRYSMHVLESGVPPVVDRGISARLRGGRCSSGDPQAQCAVNADCGLFGTCVHTETLVSILLFDFDFKQRVLQGECPFDVENLTLDAELSFSGSDETGNRRTVEAKYVSTFANFDNCEDE